MPKVTVDPKSVAQQKRAIAQEHIAELLTAPLGQSGVLEIPAAAESVVLRYAPLNARDRFGEVWVKKQLSRSLERQNWFTLDLNQLGLADDDYEYEFDVLREDGSEVIAADPFAEEITRFNGYRGVFRMRNGQRWRAPFSWEGELADDKPLRNNHEIVIYEMPMRWMEDGYDNHRQVSLGTFEKAAFARVDELQALGINCIELLPVQDSADTLNWGYGTRFFFAPDLDMGGAVDLKYFIKQCHRRGIRVVFDVVMNHARECPLEKLDYDSYFLPDGKEHEHEPGRGENWGGRMFRFRSKGADGTYSAREFHYSMAEFLIREYHADGFRIDEFRGIDHWEFIQEFRKRSWEVHQRSFPGRPFIVIAEDSWRRAVITHDDPSNPGGAKITDSMWNFGFRDETRRMMRDELHTQWGQASRSERIRWTISGSAVWDDWNKTAQPGFYDMAQAVNYLTSHDVEKEHEKRIMNSLFGPLLSWYGRPSHLEHIRWVADNVHDRPGGAPDVDRHAHGEALERVRSAFALLLTSVGIPMILAGDEFGDVHDLDNTNWQLKMSDSVDYSRRYRSKNNENLWNKVSALIQQRTSHPALQRNEVDFFYFHPRTDENDGEAVFAYCRTGGNATGDAGQVVIVANACGRYYPEYHLPWPWDNFSRVTEVAAPDHAAPLSPSGTGWAKLSLAPFQVRVFTT